MKIRKLLANSILCILTFSVFLINSCGEKPKSAVELLELGKHSYAAEDYYEARQFFGKAIALKPSDRDILYYLGKTYAAEYMFDSAFAHLSRADKLYRNDREINQLLHEVSVQAGQYQAAIDALLTLSRTGDPIEQYYRRIAEYALTDSIGHVAYYYYSKLIEKEPDSLNHYLNCADAAVIKSAVPDAIEVTKAAMKRFGELPQLLANLGLYYSYQKNYPEAEGLFRVLLAKDTSLVYQLQLATVLTFQEEKAKKQEAYALFQKLRPRAFEKLKLDSLMRMLERDLGIE